MSATIKEIYIAEAGSAPMQQPEVQAEAGRGLVGDRYYNGDGTFSEKLEGNPKSHVTFIASEEIDAFNSHLDESLGYGDVRRNIVTQGIELKTLIGKEFTIGRARFLGIEHCEPCAHLAATVNSKVIPHLINTGLRASILESGIIEVDQKISTCN